MKRTWGVLEERWTRENAPNRMEALREVKRAFEHTWRDKGIGERGGLVCIPSVGISREAIEVPRPSAPANSHGSQVGVVGGEAVASAAHLVNVDGKQRGHMVSKVDGKERATRRALETCARVIRNFIKTEAGGSARRGRPSSARGGARRGATWTSSRARAPTAPEE